MFRLLPTRCAGYGRLTNAAALRSLKNDAPYLSSTRNYSPLLQQTTVWQYRLPSSKTGNNHREVQALNVLTLNSIGLSRTALGSTSLLHTSTALSISKFPLPKLPDAGRPTSANRSSDDVASATSPLPEPENTENKTWRETYRVWTQTAKQYGIVATCVHITNSHVWGIGFLIIVLITGIDVVPILEYFNCSETVMKPFKTTGIGAVAIALGLFQLSAPVRLPFTIIGTHYAVRYIRRSGKPRWFYNKCFKNPPKPGTSFLDKKIIK